MAGERPYVLAWPDEAVQLIDAEPLGVFIQAEFATDIAGQFDSGGGVGRRAVCYGGYCYFDIAALHSYRHHHGAWPVLSCVQRAGRFFVAPEEPVANQQARARDR